MRILIIENEITLNTILTNSLQEINYNVDSKHTLEDAMELIKSRNYNLIIGDESCVNSISKIKLKSKALIIILSSKTDKKDEILFLKKGADDFLPKPIDFDLLIARVEARLRFGRDNEDIKINDLIINSNKEKVTFKNKEINLKGKNFEVLKFLANSRGEVVKKRDIISAIWAEPELIKVNVVEVCINQIRKLLDKEHNIYTIETVRKEGYRFNY